MVNVALAKMAEDFGVPTTGIEWVAIGYLPTYAAVIPEAGWLGDRFGTRRVVSWFVDDDDVAETRGLPIPDAHIGATRPACK